MWYPHLSCSTPSPGAHDSEKLYPDQHGVGLRGSGVSILLVLARAEERGRERGKEGEAGREEEGKRGREGGKERERKGERGRKSQFTLTTMWQR